MNTCTNVCPDRLTPKQYKSLQVRILYDRLRHPPGKPCARTTGVWIDEAGDIPESTTIHITKRNN